MSRFGIAAACGFVAAAIPLAVILNIWQDESFTLHTTAYGIAYAFRESIAFEQSAPLYFVLVAALRTVGSAIWYLRGFSIACIVATILCIAPLVRRYAPSIHPYYPTLTVALNPLAFWAALEMRPYALIVLDSALLLLTFYDAFLVARPRRSQSLIFAIVATLALYTQFYLAFLIVGLFVALLFYRRAAAARATLTGAAIALAFVPMLMVVPAQVANFRAPFPHPTFALSFASVTFTMARFVVPALLSARLLLAVAVIALVMVAMRARVALRSRAWLLPVATLIAALAFIVVTNRAGVVVLSRHVSSLFVPSVMSVYAMIGMLRQRMRERVSLGWSATAALLAAISIIVTYWPLAKPGDWIRVSTFVQARERAGEPIAVFEAESALPFSHYYRGRNRVVAVPVAVDFHHYDLSAFIVRDMHQVASSFPKTRHVWLLRTADCQADGISFGCAILDAYIQAHYRTLFSRAFFRANVLLLQKR